MEKMVEKSDDTSVNETKMNGKCCQNLGIFPILRDVDAFESDDFAWQLNLRNWHWAFANASYSANFIVVIWFLWSSADSVAPFDLINELTREQLSLKRINSDCFLLIRCPIARDESKWTKWEKEAINWQIDDQWNQIDIRIYIENHIGDGLLDSTPGPSDQQK
ncbi:hypothetical protein niasHT_035902 [Heterodera trifolii]|uniref:Uncharacterized protein n=1 Tax=Heterodera trifolii TaxID=157864 RepID=A0ABD2ICR0_9BILA